MPQIMIEIDSRSLSREEKNDLRELIKKESLERFSVPGRALTADSFSVSFPEYGECSERSHSVIIRIYLHPDPERVKNADKNGSELAHIIKGFLKEINRNPSWTIGVSITFAEISWSEA